MKTNFAIRSAVASASAFAASAFAAVPADVTTALSDMKTDALTLGGAVLVAAVAIFAIKFIRKGL